MQVRKSYPSRFLVLVTLFFHKFQFTVSGVRGILPQAVLDSVTRPAAGGPGHLQGRLCDKLSMEETNALVPQPNLKAATHNHVQVRKMVKLYPSFFYPLVMLFSYKFKCTVSGVRGALLQAVLDCVTRLAAEVQGQSQGLLFEKLSMEETNALVPVPN